MIPAMKSGRRAWDLKVFGYINLCRSICPCDEAAARRRDRKTSSATAGERFFSRYIIGSAGNAGP